MRSIGMWAFGGKSHGDPEHSPAIPSPCTGEGIGDLDPAKMHLLCRGTIARLDDRLCAIERHETAAA